MTGPDRSPEDAARDEGRQGVNALILRMAAATGAEITTRPIYPGAYVTGRYPEPGAGIRFALMLQDAATAAVREHIKYARQEGLTWAQIGEALGLGPKAEETGLWVADLAFDFAAGFEHARPFQTLMVTWACPACGEYIHDRGPAGGRPEDDEPGHKPTCARLAALTATYEASRGNE
jgi:hypothetical protein